MSGLPVIKGIIRPKCRHPAARVNRTLVATAETFVPGGVRLSRAADTPQLFAEALGRLVGLTPPVSALPPLDPPPHWARWDHDQVGTWPDDPDFDLNARAGPEWLEELAQRVRLRLLRASTLPSVVGHGDWASQNLRWVNRRLHAVHDWDSVASRPEATMAGMAAIVFPASGTLNEQATPAESQLFLDAYEATRGYSWSAEEREVCWAAGLWVQACKAKFTLKRDSMATEVILRLPDHVYHQAARLAQLMDRNVERVLAETIASALSPLGTSALDLTPVQELSDSDLLAAADLRMHAAQGRRPGHLLDRQQAGTLREVERSELTALGLQPAGIHHKTKTDCLYLRPPNGWRAPYIALRRSSQ